MQRVGMIGLGLLGAAMANRFIGAGYDVLGYDLLAERRDALARAGAQAAESPLAVAERCDTILLSLPDSSVVAAVVSTIESALRPGQLLIDTTTGEPLDAEALGAKLTALGVRFVEATIAGSSAQVSAGNVIAMAGGAAEPVQAASRWLSCFASQVFHTGDWGSGSRMKLVVNLVLGLNRAVLAEGLTLAQALQIDPNRALEILKASPAYAQVMDTKGDKMISGDFAPQAKLSQHLKDVRLILASGQRTGVDLPLSTMHRSLLEYAEAAGFGGQDNSAVIRAYKAPKSKPASRGHET